MTDGKSNPALDNAIVLAFDEIEEAQIQERSSGAKSGQARFDEDGTIISDIPEPQQGTYERFMGSMGNPFQWKG